MMLYVSIAVLLLVKFGVYAYYAGILNKWFSQTRNIYVVSAVRLGISLVFTGINFTLTASTLGTNTPGLQLLPLLTAFLFGALAWYIVLLAPRPSRVVAEVPLAAPHADRDEAWAPSPGFWL